MANREGIVGIQYSEYTTDDEALPSVSITAKRHEVGLVLEVDAYNMLGKDDVARLLSAAGMDLQEWKESEKFDLSATTSYPKPPEQEFQPTHVPFNPQPGAERGR